MKLLKQTDRSMTKKLTRSRSNRMVAGVCGGLGNYFNIDPVVVRIVYAACLFLGGTGAVLYLIMWLLIPEE